MTFELEGIPYSEVVTLHIDLLLITKKLVDLPHLALDMYMKLLAIKRVMALKERMLDKVITCTR